MALLLALRPDLNPNLCDNEGRGPIHAACCGKSVYIFPRDPQTSKLNWQNLNGAPDHYLKSLDNQVPTSYRDTVLALLDCQKVLVNESFGQEVPMNFPLLVRQSLMDEGRAEDVFHLTKAMAEHPRIEPSERDLLNSVIDSAIFERPDLLDLFLSSEGCRRNTLSFNHIQPNGLSLLGACLVAGNEVAFNWYLSRPETDVELMGTGPDSSSEITPLTMVISTPNLAPELRQRMFRRLLQHPKLNPLKGNSRMETALHEAAVNDDPVYQRLLLELPGIDINVKTAGNWTPLHYAAVAEKKENLWGLLRDPRLDLDQQDKRENVLGVAVDLAKVESTRMLLAAGMDVTMPHHRHDLEMSIADFAIVSMDQQQQLDPINSAIPTRLRIVQMLNRAGAKLSGIPLPDGVTQDDKMVIADLKRCFCSPPKLLFLSRNVVVHLVRGKFCRRRWRDSLAAQRCAVVEAMKAQLPGFVPLQYCDVPTLSLIILYFL